MQKITRETIRQLASSETVYYRGMRYYACPSTPAPPPS